MQYSISEIALRCVLLFLPKTRSRPFFLLRTNIANRMKHFYSTHNTKNQGITKLPKPRYSKTQKILAQFLARKKLARTGIQNQESKVFHILSTGKVCGLPILPIPIRKARASQFSVKKCNTISASAAFRFGLRSQKQKKEGFQRKTLKSDVSLKERASRID